MDAARHGRAGLLGLLLSCLLLNISLENIPDCYPWIYRFLDDNFVVGADEARGRERRRAAFDAAQTRITRK